MCSRTSQAESEALSSGNRDRAAVGASGAWLATLWDQIPAGDEREGRSQCRSYQVAAHGAQPAHEVRIRDRPRSSHDLDGTVVVSTHGQSTRQLVARADPQSFRRTLELVLERPAATSSSSSTGRGDGHRPRHLPTSQLPDDRSAAATLRRRRLAGRSRPSGTAPSASGISTDATAMMGGGLCWLDYDERRLARSVRRQLVRRRRHQPRPTRTRRASPERALPKRRADASRT